MDNSSLITLGGFAFKVDGMSTRSPATRKARALMAFLIMNRNTDAPRERLFEIFWPDADPDRARDSLSTALHSVRRCVRSAGAEPADFLFATNSVVRWTGETALDAQQFAVLAVRETLEASREALQLYRGDFLEGDYDNWTVAERERLAGLYESVLARVVRTAKDSEAAHQFIARNPYDEEPYAALAEAELAAGRRSAAAAWVERCRNALSEVGEKPSPAFEARFGGILHVEPLVTDEVALPFAGREAELASLAARLAEAAKKLGSVTLVHGEAGIGKSALLNRAATIAGENGLRVVAVRCRGDIPSTFAPWQELFSGLCGDDFQTFVSSQASGIATAVAHAIATRLAEPSALIFDDVHELAGEALDIFVAFVREAGPEHAIIAGARPEGLAKLRSLLADVATQELPLGRLDRSDLDWALAQTLGSGSPQVLDVLYDRTGGHPLFFTGLLNSLVTAGALARDRHAWQLIKPVGPDVELPDTVRRFIETRLQARGDAARTVACALALEPSANADDLASVLNIDESTTLDALDDLLALGLITQPHSGSQFAFAHDLIREVAAAGLNAGRRTALHRAFAQRLNASGLVETSLRRARHWEAAGEPLAAAQSYLTSAEEALELNAAQDAIDRCDAGLREGEKLERAARPNILLASLHRTAARAAIVGGNADEAIRRAREAVNLAQAAQDTRAASQGALDLAVIEGTALLISEQRSDAATAAKNAIQDGDVGLAAQALVQQAAAARELGLRAEAFERCRAAHNLALECGRTDLVVAALEELLRAQLTWWLFDDALETASVGWEAARRLDPLVEAGFLHARCALWYLLGRFDDAEAELQAALRIAQESAVQRRQSLAVVGHRQPYLVFASYYMAGKVAIARERWDGALDAADKAAVLRNIAKLPRYSEALALLRIDALLRRNRGGDSEAAHALSLTLCEATLAQGMIGWSDCVELATARVAARLHTPNAGVRLRRAADTLEENAQRTPLDADVAFARLTEAAVEANEAPVALRARVRSKYYQSRCQPTAGKLRAANGLI